MNAKNWLIAGLVVWCVASTWFSVDRNEYAVSREIELKRAEKDLKARDKSIRVLIDSLHRQDLEWMKSFQEATIRADRAEADHKKIKAKYDQIRFMSFTSDHQRDSVLSAILSN